MRKLATPAWVGPHRIGGRPPSSRPDCRPTSACWRRTSVTRSGSSTTSRVLPASSQPQDGLSSWQQASSETNQQESSTQRWRCWERRRRGQYARTPPWRPRCQSSSRRKSTFRAGISFSGPVRRGDVHNQRDAIFAAARYLRARGDSPGGLSARTARPGALPAAALAPRDEIHRRISGSPVRVFGGCAGPRLPAR